MKEARKRGRGSAPIASGSSGSREVQRALSVAIVAVGVGGAGVLGMRFLGDTAGSPAGAEEGTADGSGEEDVSGDDAEVLAI